MRVILAGFFDAIARAADRAFPLAVVAYLLGLLALFGFLFLRLTRGA